MLFRSHVPRGIATASGAVELEDALYRPLVEALAADDYTPKNLTHLAAGSACRKLPLTAMIKATLMLTGLGSVQPVEPASVAEAAIATCRRLNACLLDHALESTNVSALASPMVGTGVFVAHEEMLFLHALAGGPCTPEIGRAHV